MMPKLAFLLASCVVPILEVPCRFTACGLVVKLILLLLFPSSTGLCKSCFSSVVDAQDGSSLTRHHHNRSFNIEETKAKDAAEAAKAKDTATKGK